MPLRETTVARLGLVALAVALWRCAGPLVFDGLLPRYPLAVVLLAIAYVVSFVALLAATSSSERVARWASGAIVAFVVATVVYSLRDWVRRASADFYPTTDGHLFMETAARYLLHGKNPYAEGLAEGFRIYRMPLSHVTPLLDGDFSERQAYPALSFLALVPALALHVPTYVVYASAFVAAVAIVVQKAPWWARPFVVAVFTLDEAYYAFSFGGVTDTVWVLFLVGAVVWWRARPTWAAVLIGLACAYKQHPWFLVPLLVLRIAHESGEKPWGPSVRRFLAVIIGVFALVNIPFILIGPHRWFLGVTEPLRAPMVQLSEGLTAFSMTGWIPMPRRGTTAIFWTAYGVALFAYARHTRVLRDWCWIVPAVVLWFGYRALMSYWYFFAIIAMAALFSRSDGDESPDESSDPISWRPTAAAAGALAVGIGLFLVWCATRPAPFVIELAGPVEAWDRRAFVARVHFTNKLNEIVSPQFWLQSSGQQPLPWVIDFGPHDLGPHASAVYVIRASHHFKEFDTVEGARLEVHDRTDPGKRAFLSIPGEPTIKIPDAVPNPDFRFLETRTRAPSGWAFESSVAKLVPKDDRSTPARIAFEFGLVPPPKASQLAGCVVPQHVVAIEPSTRRAVLSTVLPLPEGRLRFHVNVPPDANKPPFEKLYGVLLGVRGFEVIVLIGDQVERGTLPNGQPYVGLAAPRGVWSTVDVVPRAILERVGASLAMTRFTYLRASTLDFPSIPLEVGLFGASPAGTTATLQFGRVEQEGASDFEVLAEHPSPTGLAAWRAELDLENGNYWKAWDRLEQVNRIEPTQERLVKQGDAYLFGYEYAKARDVYARAAEQGNMEGEAGLGFALIHLGDFEGARVHLERARDAYREWEKSPPRFHYLAIQRGLTTVLVKQQRCKEAIELYDEVVSEAPGAPPPPLDPCTR